MVHAIPSGGRPFSSVESSLGSLPGPPGILAEHRILRELIEDKHGCKAYWGLLAIIWMLPFLIWRLLDEERLLANELPGYTDYQRKVRYRLVPGCGNRSLVECESIEKQLRIGS